MYLLIWWQKMSQLWAKTLNKYQIFQRLYHSRGPDYFFNENKPVGRFHRCHTLGFKNGLRVQKTPSQAIGGTKTIQDLLIAQPAQGEDTPFHGSLGYVIDMYSGCNLDTNIFVLADYILKGHCMKATLKMKRHLILVEQCNRNYCDPRSVISSQGPNVLNTYVLM